MITRKEIDEFTASLDYQINALVELQRETKSEIKLERLKVDCLKKNIRLADRAIQKAKKLKAGLLSKRMESV